MSRSFGWFGLPVAVLCWLASVPPAGAADPEAVAAIQKLGGLPVRAGSDPAAPVVKVEFNRAALTDKTLEEAVRHLKKLRFLRTVTLGFTKVTDAGLVHLKGLPDLEELGLAQTAVTDAGLTHLKGLKNLKRLDLDRTQVTDTGADDLKAALPGLEITRVPAPRKE
jgi:Leucine Rich repeat